MPLPLLVALLAPIDPAAGLAHAEAIRRQAPVAFPIPGGRSVRPGESLEGLRIGAKFVAIPEGLARSNRPLLLPARSQNEDLAIRATPTLAVLGRLVADAPDSEVEKLPSAGFMTKLENIPEADRATVMAAYGQRGVEADDFRDATFGVVPYLHVALKGADGKSTFFGVNSRTAPYDPTPILDRMRFVDPDPVPAPLRKAVAGHVLAVPTSSLTLAEWAKRLGGRDLELRVDARATGWQTVLGAPGATVPLADALRLVARSQRLYWRPIGTGWLLAASPGDPRPFALSILKAERMESGFVLFARLAQLGLLPKDALSLMANGETPVKSLSTEDRAGLARLITQATPWPGQEKSLQGFLNDSSWIARSQVSVAYSMNMVLRSGPEDHTTSSVGMGISLP